MSLRKRIRKGEIVVLKSDKSSKLCVIKKNKYLQVGIKDRGKDKKIARKDLQDIEKKINEHTRLLCKIMNIGEENNHLQRIIESKETSSEQAAPKYFLFKDHKKEKEAYRPVVSGCSSNTLGLSNLLSEVIESLCDSVSDPYEVNSDRDLLSRLETFNKKVENEKKLKGDSWDWREEWVLLGSDVVSLFPSLSAERTAKIVRKQVEKSLINWENIDDKLKI